MLLGIWLVPCQHIPSLNPPRKGTLAYVNVLTRDDIHEYGEASLWFAYMFPLGKNKNVGLEKVRDINSLRDILWSLVASSIMELRACMVGCLSEPTH